jgi:hypothetical protein
MLICSINNPATGVLEELTESKLVKKLSVFYETGRFVIVLRRASHWSLL